jgi:hypothetical protein
MMMMMMGSGGWDFVRQWCTYRIDGMLELPRGEPEAREIRDTDESWGNTKVLKLHKIFCRETRGTGESNLLDGLNNPGQQIFLNALNFDWLLSYAGSPAFLLFSLARRLSDTQQILQVKEPKCGGTV